MLGPLCELLQEPVASVKQRELTVLQDLLAKHNNRVVLFGAGTLGRRAATLLAGMGIRPLAFSDNDHRANIRWRAIGDAADIPARPEQSTYFCVYHTQNDIWRNCLTNI